MQSPDFRHVRVVKTVTLSTFLDAAPETVWRHVQTSRLLDYVTSPLIRFRPHDPDGFPDTWVPGDFKATMYLFGVLPIGVQVIGIRFPDSQHHGVRTLRDEGHGTAARVWDHLIHVEAENGGTRYTDAVTIDAGWRSPFVAAFARMFYGHRQKRWRRLVAEGFEAIDTEKRQDDTP